ncbi:MAG: cohesin domain-containing protein [Minisyncoccia bacterium]
MLRTIGALLLLFPFSVSAAAVYFEPAEGIFGLGDTFIVNVRVLPDECVNAAEVEIQFPPHLRAVDFGKGDSILSLWVEEPLLEEGRVRFAGGIPGGYCGRIQGDPALSNILGKIVFTVTDVGPGSAQLNFSAQTALYLNDGLGTKVTPEMPGASFTILPTPQLSENPWIAAVQADTIPPDAFTIDVESTRGVFGGRYFIVFSTLDKQSGIDHYEIFERGAWKTVTSPYELKSQSLRGGIQLKAIDKAGNERLGTYVEGSAPPLETPYSTMQLLLVALGVLVVVGAAGLYMRRLHRETPPAPPA